MAEAIHPQPAGVSVVVVNAATTVEAKPETEGQRIMRAQRAARRRLFRLQHAHGEPIKARK